MRTSASFVFLIILIFTPSCASSPKKQWGYYGVESPDQWGEISSQYQACNMGQSQSPIDLSLSQAQQLNQKIRFNYRNSHTEVIDNGHTIQAKFNETNSVEINSTLFFLDQLHFHTHSEHSLDGVFYPIEMHFVHRSKKGETLVLAFFVELVNPKKNQFGFFQGIPNIGKNEGKSTIKLSKLIRYAGAHFYYQGSLTTPPCTEGVHWIIFDKHINLHRDQVKKFKAIYSRNYRPVQRTNDRTLYHSSL